MNSQTVSLKHDNCLHSLETLHISKQRFDISHTRTFLSSNFPKIKFCKECLSTDCPLKEKSESSKDKLTLCAAVSMKNNSELTAKVSCSDVLFNLDFQKNYPSRELGKANLPLKEETSKPESRILTSDFTVTSCDCGSTRNVSDKKGISYNSELQKENQTMLKFEVEKNLQENKRLETKVPNYFIKFDFNPDIYVEDDFPKSKDLRVQKDNSSEKYDFSYMLVGSVKPMECENVFTQNRYSEENVQNDITVELEEVLKCEDSIRQMDDSEECFQDINFPIEAEIQLKEREELEFPEERIEYIDDDKENDLLKSVFSKIKIDDPADKLNQCNYLEEDFMLESMCSVFDFIFKNEENAFSCHEKQNILISSPMVGTEYEHSEPDCVKVVRSVISSLADIEKDLLMKENEVIQQKRYFETNAKELISFCNFDKTKENESNQLRMGLVDRCDKLLVDLKKDKIQSEWYSESLQNTLNYLQQNCLHQKL